MDRTPWTGRRCVSKGSSRLRAWRKLHNWDLPISFRNCPDRPGLFALARVCVRACVRVQGLPASIAVLCCNNVCPPSWSGCREVQVLPTTPAAPSIEYPVSRLVVRRVRFFCARARAHGCTPTSAHWWAGDGCLWANISISCGRSGLRMCGVPLLLRSSTLAQSALSSGTERTGMNLAQRQQQSARAVTRPGRPEVRYRPGCCSAEPTNTIQICPMRCHWLQVQVTGAGGTDLSLACMDSRPLPRQLRR